MSVITISTTHDRQVKDITEEVASELYVKNGIVVLQLLHTTAALTTADLDPGTDEDMLSSYWDMIPEPSGGFQHPHNPEHAPAHLLASLIGPSLSLSVENRTIQLGTWQRVVLVEFDGPRERKIAIKQVEG